MKKWEMTEEFLTAIDHVHELEEAKDPQVGWKEWAMLVHVEILDDIRMHNHRIPPCLV
jgi:hypothetical protein